MGQRNRLAQNTTWPSSRGSPPVWEVLSYDELAATHTGPLCAELARNGTPIRPYDQLKAGHARSRGLIVVTNNRGEFDRVAGLRVEDWTI